MKRVISRVRGNALIMTLIALAVLMLVVAAAIQFTGTNREAAANKARADEVQACATTARKLLLAKLRTTVGAGTLTLDTVIPDTQSASTDKQVRTAHFDQTTPQPVIVKLDSTVMGTSRYQVRDVANTTGKTTLGGDYYRVVVTCRNPTNDAQSEVEFTFRHGI